MKVKYQAMAGIKTKKPSLILSAKVNSFWRRGDWWLDQFLLGSDERAESFSQKTGVKWFLKRLVDA